MNLEKKGGKFNIPISLSVFVIALVYFSHHYMDEMVVAVQWLAAEWVAPMFDLDSHF